MTIRADVTIDWGVSPRIITVASPSTEITIQDLLDTLRYLEATTIAMDNKPIIDAAGKESLGGGVYVGLTATLQNALVAFEARLGPEYVLCNVNGGNVVALESDLETYFVTPIHPTAFTQIVVTASSSATQTEQDAIQYSSYGGGISLDIINGVSGTEYPAGNQEFPSNNIADAVTIANTKGFSTIFIRESMIGANALNNGTDLIGFTLIGQSSVNTHLEIHDSAQCDNVTIIKCDVFGVLDGGTHIEDCKVGDINYVNGHIDDSGLYGSITLDGNDEAVLSNCYTIDQDNSAVIDMGGSGQDLAMPNYSGVVSIKNLNSSTEEIAVGLNAGLVILEDTITAGTIFIAGTGLVDNQSSVEPNVDGLINKDIIASAVLNTNLTPFIEPDTVSASMKLGAYNNRIAIDVINGVSGTEYPIGTSNNPVSNLADAHLILDNVGLNDIYIIGSLTLLSGDTIESRGVHGENRGNTSLVLSDGCVTTNALIYNLSITGTCGGRMNISNCNISNINNLCATGGNANITYCYLSNNIELNTVADQLFHFDSCVGKVGASKPIINTNGTSALVHVSRYTGGIELSGMTSVESDVTIDMLTGSITLNDTNTNGNITCRGNGWIEDELGNHIFSEDWNGVTITNETICKHSITREVLGSQLLEHDSHGALGRVAIQIAYNESVDVDFVNGESGVEFPWGMQHHSVNNIPDALEIMDLYHIDKIRILSSIDIPIGTNLNGITIIAGNTIDRTVTIPAGCSTSGMRFIGIKLDGVLDGRVDIKDSVIQNVSGFRGSLSNSSLSGGLTMSTSSGIHSHIDFCSAEGDSSAMPYIDINGSRLHILDWIGWVELRNKTSDDLLGVSANGGMFVITDTCIDGQIIFAGSGVVLADNSGAGCIVDDTELLNNTNTTKAVWDSTQGQQSLNDTELIKQIETGKWEIVNNQMIFYADDNYTEIARFNLFDEAGDLAVDNVFKRERV